MSADSGMMGDGGMVGARRVTKVCRLNVSICTRPYWDVVRPSRTGTPGPARSPPYAPPTPPRLCLCGARRGLRQGQDLDEDGLLPAVLLNGQSLAALKPLDNRKMVRGLAKNCGRCREA